MSSSAHDRVIHSLEMAVPRIQRDFVMSGPLRGALPADIRADIVRIFTQVLCRAIQGGDGEELGGFVDSVVWEARKLGVSPGRFLLWIDEYASTIRRLIDDQGWAVTRPMLEKARHHIERLNS